MTILRTIELGSGVATGLCGLAIAIVAFLGPGPTELRSLSLVEFLPSFMIWVGPPLLVAIGSYFHIRRGKTWGYVALLLGGVFVLCGTLMILAVDSKGHGLEKVIMLVPGGLTVVTMVMAMLVRRSEKRKI